jgi:lipocalin
MNFFLTCCAIALAAAVPTSPSCPPKDFSSVSNFNVQAYLGKWFVLAQQPSRFLSKDTNYCVTAEYSLIDESNIKVLNSAKKGSVVGETIGGELRGVILDSNFPSQLVVGPQFVPNFMKGPYWVAYTSPINPSTGLYDYAIVVAGPPKTLNSANNLCSASSGDSSSPNGEGLWLFSRMPDDALALEDLKNVAVGLGLDISVLNTVQQVGCN